MDKIVDYIISEVISNTFDCQYVIYKDEIESEFNITLDTRDIEELEDRIGSREEVLDVLFIDYGFDVVIGTSYIPNYEY